MSELLWAVVRFSSIIKHLRQNTAIPFSSDQTKQCRIPINNDPSGFFSPHVESRHALPLLGLEWLGKMEALYPRAMCTG